MRCFAILPFAVLGLSAPLHAAPQLAVGFGEVDVSPEVGKRPVFIAGFGPNRPATKVHDPLMARAIVLSDGTTKIAFVCVDVVGLFHASVLRVREQLTGFAYVVVSSTHNHHGPDTMGLWGRSPFQTGVDLEYLRRVEAGAAKAVQLAGAALKPAAAKIGTLKAPELLHDARKPEVKHEDLVVLRFDAPGSDKPLGLLVQWNCHPETIDSKNTEVSSDFVGAAVQALKDRYQCPVAYLSGTVGGLMTSMHIDIKNDAGEVLKEGSFEKTARYGVLLAKAAEKALSKSIPVELTPFAFRTQDFLVPVDNGIYKFASQSKVFDRTMYTWNGDPTPNEYHATADVSKPVAVKSELGYLKLGELEIAAIPGEIYPELVLGKVQTPADPGADFPDAATEPAIYDQLKGKHRMIVGLANDELGYFIPKRQWDEKPPYCYGLKSKPYGEINSVGPEAAPIICNLFKELAKPR